MNNKVIDITWELKKDQIRRKFERGFQEVKDFCKQRPDIALAVGTALVGAIGGGIKFATKRANLHKEKLLKNNYCYDRSLGHYWKLRRELTNDEWVQIDKRKKNGERLADILDSLKVLK